MTYVHGSGEPTLFPGLRGSNTHVSKLFTFGFNKLLEELLFE